ncbi:hypothetical protein ASG63_01150 [Methylobacterium sp. Leaf94]|nr:hypothetical protein ASG63_01150 [Methylobacterium sp. Leaf94]
MACSAADDQPVPVAWSSPRSPRLRIQAPRALRDAIGDAATDLVAAGAPGVSGAGRLRDMRSDRVAQAAADTVAAVQNVASSA